MRAVEQPEGIPRLRGHHLICLHFFQGEGYDAEFVRNLTRVVGRLTEEGGTVVDGSDDVCAACPSLANSQCAREPESERKIRALDTLALELLGMAPGDRFDYSETGVRMQRSLESWYAVACKGCDWEDVCTPLILQRMGSPISP